MSQTQMTSYWISPNQTERNGKKNRNEHRGVHSGTISVAGQVTHCLLLLCCTQSRFHTIQRCQSCAHSLCSLIHEVFLLCRLQSTQLTWSDLCSCRYCSPLMTTTITKKSNFISFFGVRSTSYKISQMAYGPCVCKQCACVWPMPGMCWR